MWEARETAVQGLGAARPSWCPPAEVPQDVCEIQYSMDLPVIGRTKAGLPVYRVTYDAMQAATQRLPEFMPEIKAAVQPWLDETVAHLVDTVEYEADYLSRKLMRDQVEPLVSRFSSDMEVKATGLVHELLVTTAALSAAVVVAVGVSAWWVRSKRG